MKDKTMVNLPALVSGIIFFLALNMQPAKKILQHFSGLHFSREYVCFALESFPDPIRVYQEQDGHIIKEFTGAHLFVGYSPLVFVIPGNEAPEKLQLLFSHATYSPNEAFLQKDALAILQLKRIHQQTVGTDSIGYYEGVHGTHRFLSGFQQWINGLINNWYNKKPGNVFLPNELYRQVQIAYSVPRIISLITIKIGEGVNLFPTDLHGPVGEYHYIISLRTGGKACEQVKQAGRLLLSQVDAKQAATVYSLGKNHMEELKTVSDLPFSKENIDGLDWPIPQGAISCQELELLESTTIGIHEIHLFRIRAKRILNTEAERLAHIHNAYASWQRGQQLACQ